MRFFKTPFWVKNYFKAWQWKINTKEKVIYLTFDDGPIPELTFWVLDMLQKYEAKATFFCVGDNIQKYPEIFQRIIAAGHQIGNHTYHHLNGWKQKTEVYVQDTEKCQTVITQYLKVQKPLFRPPYGKLTKQQAQILEKTFRIVMWDVLTYDFDKQLSPQRCLQQALAKTQQGSIVVFHDNIKATKNLTHTLEPYLKHFTQKGFRFEALY